MGDGLPPAITASTSRGAPAISVDIQHLLSVSLTKFTSRDKLVQHFEELHNQLNTFPRNDQRTPSTRVLAKQLLEPQIFSHSDELVRAWVSLHCVHAVRLNPARPVYNKAQCAKVFDRLNQEVRNNINMQDSKLFSVRFRMIEKLMQSEVYIGMYDALAEHNLADQDGTLEHGLEMEDEEEDDDDGAATEARGSKQKKKKKKEKEKEETERPAFDG